MVFVILLMWLTLFRRFSDGNKNWFLHYRSARKCHIKSESRLIQVYIVITIEKYIEIQMLYY